MKKIINRYSVFVVLLMAALYFFQDQKSNHSTQSKENFSQIKPTFGHDSSPLHQPFEIEQKEEQPSSEDDDVKEKECDASLNEDASNQIGVHRSHQKISLDESDVCQGESTPRYIKYRSILI